MKNTFKLFGGLLVAVALHSAAAAADIGVSIGISQPGFYGRIDVGRVPAPLVIYPQPVVIEPMLVGRPPIYLHVPPGHEKHWDKHCRSYNACNQPVYFVQDNWYREVYAPRYYGEPQRRDDRQNGRHDNGKHRGHNKFDRDRGDQ